MNKLRKWYQLYREQIGFAISQSNPHFITAEEKEKYAQIWDRLKAENAKLRITDGDEIKSVPIEYYFELIERNCPKAKPFKLTSLLNLIYKNEKKGNLDWFPYYFWSTQFRIMMNKGILRKVKDVKYDCWGYNCWVEYVGEQSTTVSGISWEQYDYIDKRLMEIGCEPMTLMDAICNDNLEKSYQVLMDNPNITKEEFLSIMGIEEDTFDISDHNLRIYKYAYCEKCGQLVDKMDYKERGYCRYCEKPTEETIAVIDEIYEKAKLVMNYLLKRNADREMIKLAIADRNLDKSYRIIEKNQNVSAEDFIKELGV